MCSRERRLAPHRIGGEDQPFACDIAMQATRVRRTVTTLTLEQHLDRIVSVTFYRGRSPMADPMACRRRARQCMHLAQTVGPGEIKQALLAIAKAWAKLAIQVNAKACEEV